MKFIVLGVILYLYYQFFYKRSALNPADEDPRIDLSDQDDGEYTDYEEVD
ncbi:MAG: hypothetical protein AAF985_11530 [Bacteroidota bacterium]